MTTDLRNYFDVVIDTHEGFRANCPMCDDTKRVFHWNEEKGVGCCWHSRCAWYAHNGGVTEYRFKAFFGDAPAYKIPKRIVQSEIVDTKLPKEFKQLGNLDSRTFKEVYNYLRSRGITRKAMEAAHLGYCKEGQFWGYIIIPVFENGEVVYWQGRRFKNRTPKFYNPKSSRKNDLLYELPSEEKVKTIILVESAFNALTLDDGLGKTRRKIYALLGSSFSDEQRQKLLMHERHAREIIIALDPDAWKKSLSIANRLLSSGPAVKLAKFPKKTDINSLGRERAWDIIDNATLYKRELHMDLIGTQVTARLC